MTICYMWHVRGDQLQEEFQGEMWGYFLLSTTDYIRIVPDWSKLPASRTEFQVTSFEIKLFASVDL